MDNTEVCNWQEVEPDYWESDCGMSWQFNISSPKRSAFNFCPKCGKKLTETRMTAEQREDFY